MNLSKIEILTKCTIAEQPSSNKTVAAMKTPQGQIDLMFMKSLLVSTGENLNEDVFLPDEMWEARHTPVLKPVDWEHNTGRELTEDEQKSNPNSVVTDNQTIGVMFNSYVVDKNNNIIDDEKTSASDFEIPEQFDIIDEAVIWKGLYPRTAARIEEGANNNTLFVSMEAWFNDYDYLVGEKIIARNEETAFLDKSLRAHGGTGVFGSSRVRRVLRNLTFGGKGIVERPANEPSVIQQVTHEPMCTSASSNQAIIDNVICDINNVKSSRTEQPREVLEEMDNKTKQDVAVASVPLDLYTKANEENVTLKAEVESKNAELETAQAAVSEKDEQIENIKSAFTKGCQELAEALPELGVKISSANSENFFAVLAEALKEDKVAQAELTEKLKAAVEKIQKIEEDAKAAARKAKVDALDASDEHKEKILASVANLDDEAFDSLVATMAEFKKKEEKEDEDEDEDKDKSEGSKTEEEELAELLNSVESSEQAPSAGEDAPQGIELDKAFSGLVNEMFKAYKPGNE